MKRIALFCDGTWQREDATHPSNVVRLAQAARATGADGRTQQVFYFPGVGTGRGSTAVGRWLDRSAGGALGWGLDINVEDAYRALVFCYEPGDEIFLFGFSRGAYTARSITGLIGRAGLLPKANVHLIPEAMARYRDRAVEAESRDSYEWRARHAPWTANTVDEIEWRRETGRPLPDALLRIAYVGVWDTVGSLGVPNYYLVSRLANRSFGFHSTNLSVLVQTARHAVAIDERRLAFAPTLWPDLAEQNRIAMNRPEGTDMGAEPVEALPYRQAWFPGDHGSVGGGHAHTGLSAYACGWIAEGAARAGLEFDEAALARIRAEEDFAQPLDTLAPGLMARLWRRGDRDGPDDLRDLSRAALARIDDGAYAPGALAKVLRRMRPDPERPPPPEEPRPEFPPP